MTSQNDEGRPAGGPRDITNAPAARIATGEGLRLTLRAVDFKRVSFVAELEDGTSRAVDVRVGSGASWEKAVRYPHVSTAEGETLGDEALDAEVRRRAGEELCRLEGARCAA